MILSAKSGFREGHAQKNIANGIYLLSFDQTLHYGFKFEPALIVIAEIETRAFPLLTACLRAIRLRPGRRRKQ
jgi:hypothetical protein